MSKPDPITPYLQQAIREKAQRDLANLDLRAAAFDGIDRALDALVELSGDLAQATPAIAQAATEPAVVAKLKKLRKAVDEARALGAEIAQSLDVPTQRQEVASARAAIVDALVAAGLDPASLSPGGEAE